MSLSPIGDGLETVAIGDRGADAHKQNLVELVGHVFRTPFVLNPGEVIQKEPQPRRLPDGGQQNVHEQGSESRAPWIQPSRKS